MKIYPERANFGGRYSEGYTIMILDDFLADLRIRVIKNCFAFFKTHNYYTKKEKIRTIKIPHPIYRIIISNRKRKDIDCIHHCYPNSKKECLRFRSNKHKYSKLNTSHMKGLDDRGLIRKSDVMKYNNGIRVDILIDYNGSFFLVSKGLLSKRRIRQDNSIYNCSKKMKRLGKSIFKRSSYKPFIDLDTYYKDRIMSVIRHDYYNTLKDYHRLI